MALLSHKNIFIISRLIVIILFVTISSRVSSQVIGTIAGTGAFNSQGDGNLATCADLMAPSGVCTDANGNIYIASQHSIRKINAVTGIITAYSGTSNPGSMN